ncbi:MAG: hypothetical protein LWW86_16835 [Micrococcales bacterium]|nr:hypothetical protein [Micrococcales bacterium]
MGSERETVEILVRDRGGKVARSRGTIELEDLSRVVTRIAARTGPNGPNSPVTQYLLREASNQLCERLMGDLGEDVTSAPLRVLSALIGHEPFVENSLNISAHHMRRRWPIASDWYADLISYVLRPQRYAVNEEQARAEMAVWGPLPLGELIDRLAEQQALASTDRQLFRLAEMLFVIWPQYAQIQQAYADYRQTVEDFWIPVYQQLMELYGLRVRPGVDLADMAWMLETLVSQAGRDHTLRYAAAHTPAHAARLTRTYIAGALESADGRLLTLEELAAREPRAL